MLSDDVIADLRTRLDTIVNYYVKLLNELAGLPIIDEWGELDDLIGNKEVSFTVEDAEKPDSIFRKIRDRHEHFIGTKVSESLAEECRKFWEDYWAALISNARVKNQLWKAGEGEKTISSFSPSKFGRPEDKYLLMRVRANEDEAAHYLVQAEIESDLDGELSMKLFPPFAKHSDGTYVDWQRMRNQFQHRDWKTNRKGDKHLELFYGAPGYLRFELTDYEGLVERCFRVLSDDFTKDQSAQLREAALNDASLREKARYSSEMIRSQIKEIDWNPDHYVSPVDSGDIIQDLTQALERSPLVQIQGEGGLGKTALALKFIIDNLDGKTDGIGPYENVVWLSSKNWPQGEWDIQRYYRDIEHGKERDKRGLVSPRDNPSIALSNFNEAGRFSTFIEQTAGLSDQWASRAIDRVFDLIDQEHILVVLDNFEDVMDRNIQQDNKEELEKYLEFFNKFTMRSIGRIIVTTREFVNDPNIRRIHLQPIVSMRARFELMQNRATHLSQNYQIPFHNMLFTFYFGGDTTQRTAAFDRLGRQVGEEFQANLGHPQILFMFTRELMLAAGDHGDIESTILWVATHEDEEGNSFSKRIRDHSRWSIGRSYSKVNSNPDCISILKELWQVERGMSVDELIEKIDLSRGDAQEAIRTLLSHDVFLERKRVDQAGPAAFDDEDDSFKLKVGARRILFEQEEFKELANKSNFQPSTEGQGRDLKILEELDSAVKNDSQEKIEQYLKRLVRDPPDRPGGKLVKISNRRPINEDMVRFALKISDAIRVKYKEMKD